MTNAYFRSLAPLILLVVPWSGPLAAQGVKPVRLEADSASVAVLPVALYTAQANQQETSDSSKSSIATAMLTERLGELLGPQAIMGDRVGSELGSPAANRVRGDQPCNVIVACARAVATTLHASWVVMAKISKTSNLIWLFTGQLIQTSTGKILLDDSTELKGEPDRMVKAGTRIFAERVARTIKRGGTVTDYPTGVPK